MNEKEKIKILREVEKYLNGFIAGNDLCYVSVKLNVETDMGIKAYKKLSWKK